MQYPIIIPELVARAHELAIALGFDLRPEGNPPEGAASASCCLDEVGSLLRTLSSLPHMQNVGEIGTGAGVGTAWMLSGLLAGHNGEGSGAATLTTVEIDEKLASAAAEFFEDYEQVEVLSGSWEDAFKSRAPFDLLFADGGGVGNADPGSWPAIVELVKPGGMMVVDDLTPEEYWPAGWKGKPDPKRELAFRSGYFQATEVRTRADSAVLLMIRN